MALSDDDLEKIGKLIENAAERRFAMVREELHEEILEVRREADEHYIAIVQELQGAEQRLQKQIDGLTERIDGLQSQADTTSRDVADIKAAQAQFGAMLTETHQWVNKIFHEHGGRLDQIYDSLLGIYKREHQLEVRTDYLEAMFRQRFPSTQNP